MPSVVVTHEVNDTEHWLASPKREEVFAPLGVTNIRTFVHPQHSNQVAVSMDVPDMDAVMEMMGSDTGRAAMEHDGVLAETVVIYVEG